MGNWHCVPSGCAEVVYKEYESPRVRWRYPGEGWQEIVGANDYSTEIIPDLNLNTAYRFYSRNIPTANLNTGVWGAETPNSSSFSANGINNWHLRALWRQTNYYRYPANAKFFTGESTSYSNLPIQDRQANYYLRYTNNLGQLIEQFIGGSTGIWVTKIEAVDPNKRKNNCIFKVFKSGQIVYQESRAVCPEVEKLPCRLSDQVKIIKIDKFPYLERVEVVPYEYRNFGGGVYQAIIPNECLNIYNNLTTTIIPQFKGFPTPSNASEATYGFIAQICSAPGCPPPEYQVICDCGCEECPDGTCAVNCDGHICCYDDSGRAVKQIAIADYCGSAV